MKQMPFENALKMLVKHKIPFAKHATAKDADSAAKEAKKIGYPVAVKGISKEVVHKTDIGGVEVGINNEDELMKACNSIEKNFTKKTKKKPESFLVQQMASGQEVIIGLKQDPQFGPVIMFGLGGIFVEVLKDVSFRVAPVSRKECLSMIQEIKGYKVLEGARGRKKANIEAIVKILLSVSSLAEKSKSVAEMDLNPVIVNDKSAVVVDARMMTE